MSGVGPAGCLCVWDPRGSLKCPLLFCGVLLFHTTARQRPLTQQASVGALSPHPAQRVSRLPLHLARCLSPPLCSPLLLGRALVGRQPAGGPLRTRAGEQLWGAGACHLAAPWVCCPDVGRFPEWQGHWTLTSRERGDSPSSEPRPASGGGRFYLDSAQQLENMLVLAHGECSRCPGAGGGTPGDTAVRGLQGDPGSDCTPGRRLGAPSLAQLGQCSPLTADRRSRGSSAPFQSEPRGRPEPDRHRKHESAGFELRVNTLSCLASLTPYVILVGSIHPAVCEQVDLARCCAVRLWIHTPHLGHICWTTFGCFDTGVISIYVPSLPCVWACGPWPGAGRPAPGTWGVTAHDSTAPPCPPRGPRALPLRFASSGRAGPVLPRGPEALFPWPVC